MISILDLSPCLLGRILTAHVLPFFWNFMLSHLGGYRLGRGHTLSWWVRVASSFCLSALHFAFGAAKTQLLPFCT